MSGLLNIKKIISFFLAIITITSAINFSVSTAFAESEKVNSTYSNKYKVKSIDKLYLRRSAGKKSDKIKLISKDTLLYVINNSGNYWVKVKDSKGITGYAPTKKLNIVKGTSVTIKCKTTTMVNFRKGKGTSYKIISTIPNNTTVTVKANDNNNWIKVYYKNKTGYISKKYCKVIFRITSANKSDNQPTTQPATQPATNNDVPLSLNSTSTSMYVNCYHQLLAVNNTNEAVKWSSSNKSIATVTKEGIIYGKKIGFVTIKASVSKKTVSCKVNVLKMTSSVNISNKAYTSNRAKTIYLTSTTKGVNWYSTNPSVASVKDGLVECKKQGKTVISVRRSGGWATCLVTVKGREAVRFTYANPNSAPLNSNVTFIAITDKIRTDVKFVVTLGTTKYEFKATKKTVDGDTYVWKGTKKLTKAGAYSVVAYSKYGSSWSKSTGSYGNVFVTSVEDNTTPSLEERHASNKIITFISNYEGLLSSATYDPLTSFPCLTVGYGRVIYAGEAFYNNMTKNEAFAYLVDSVENDGYVSKVNRFLLDKKIKFNQHQFDSLVSFVYNCGTGTLSNDSDIQNLFNNTYPSSEAKPTTGKTSCQCALRKTASSSATNLKTLKKSTKITLLSAQLKNNNFYYVKESSGKKGYISYKALTVTKFNTSGSKSLSYTIKKDYINNFFCYHHAGGVCYAGLLYRRIDEGEIFYHNEYTRNGEYNKNNFYFRCITHNPGFGCG